MGVRVGVAATAVGIDSTVNLGWSGGLGVDVAVGVSVGIGVGLALSARSRVGLAVGSSLCPQANDNNIAKDAKRMSRATY